MPAKLTCKGVITAVKDTLFKQYADTHTRIERVPL